MSVMFGSVLANNILEQDREQLKTCPFCGYEAELVIPRYGWYVRCTGCLARTEGSSDKGVAIDDWNMRVDDD